jgi:hypothetical protein
MPYPGKKHRNTRVTKPIFAQATPNTIVGSSLWPPPWSSDLTTIHELDHLEGVSKRSGVRSNQILPHFLFYFKSAPL